MLKITIGRDQMNQYVVSELVICKHHAEVTKAQTGEMWITDMDTVNGTYVNGQRIKTRKITMEDEIVLAGKHPVEIRTLLRKANDYSDEFQQLKVHFIAFDQKKKRIRKNGQIKTGIYRMLPLSVGGAGMFIIGQLADNQFIRMLGGLFVVVFPVIGVFWATNCAENLPEKIKEVENEYVNKLICPKCGSYIGRAEWDDLVRRKICPRCQAIWVIDS